MNYKDYLKSDWWKDTRKFFNHLHRKKCWVCGHKKNVVLHHKHYKTKGYEDGDELCWLCNECHKELHFNDGEKITPDTDQHITYLEGKLKMMRMDRRMFGAFK